MDKKLGFGLMRLPLTDPNDSGSIDIPLLKQMVDTFLERGFTYFDTAWMYCGSKSENAVKEALSSRYPRDRYTVTSKLPSGSLTDLDSRDVLFNTQLEKTGLEYFDYYLLHAVGGGNVERFKELKCFEWIKAKKAEGKVKHIGFSYHDGPELLDKLLTEHPEFDVVQLQINYLDWENPKVQSRACYEVARKHNKPVIIMEPVKGGALANVPESVERMFFNREPKMSNASWAVRFAAGLPGVMMVLSGMSNMEQLLDNTGFMADFKPLTKEETELALFAGQVIAKDMKIACTGCAYCLDQCPQNIAIPQYFKLYNENGDKQEYDALTKEFGKAGDCIVCGACEKICPQQLPVRKYLREIAEDYE
ncbi:MAG: 4Fe-4S dicluster domain-containing protein [Ruminococcaceae bacterium]|nr:4Fe-4S dicluster domain-containing protein [Oscillospiraceae bacterium]